MANCAPKPKRWVIDVPLETPSLNVCVGPKPWKYPKIRRAWCLAVMCLWCGPDFPDATRRRRVTVHTRRYKPIPDYDNFIGGLKPVMDALKKARAIVDDSDEWCEHGDHTQVVDRKNRGTRIVVEEVT